VGTNRVCGKEAVFDLAVWMRFFSGEIHDKRVKYKLKTNIREGEESMELDTFTHLSGKCFYSLLMQSIPHSPDAIN
jgi:hypothetical protein